MILCNDATCSMVQLQSLVLLLRGPGPAPLKYLWIIKTLTGKYQTKKIDYLIDTCNNTNKTFSVPKDNGSYVNFRTMTYIDSISNASKFDFCILHGLFVLKRILLLCSQASHVRLCANKGKKSGCGQKLQKQNWMLLDDLLTYSIKFNNHILKWSN